ncbi:hypothetical protein CYY_005159 [Polysphondylium violaceum]|uniref:CobW/HypB/UreG nucleotide-binding domain-containing protein n=1 Tax=Polysphondylium violaceum TaxID=133409 RepID=A0A8J4PTW8_9MYCE|nr:hypothetical protein CYY_005159 [Polysphondylium violaceum]
MAKKGAASKQKKVVKKIPSLLVVGFTQSGKSSLYHNIVKSLKKEKVAFLFDTEKLPESVLKTENCRVLVEDLVISLNNGSMVTVIDEQLLAEFIHDQAVPFDYCVFISGSFDSTILLDLLQCIDEGELAKLADKIDMYNVICTIDCQTFISDLKSKDLLKDRFPIFEDIFKNSLTLKEDNQDSCCDENGVCSKQESDCCNENGVCSKTTTAPEKKDSCCDEKGNCTKEKADPTPVKKDSCCDEKGNCTKEKATPAPVKKDSCCDEKGNCTKATKQPEAKIEEIDSDEEEEEIIEGEIFDDEFDLVKKSEKKISSLIFDQIAASSTIILNKTDLVSKEELEFIQKLLNLISSSRIIITTHSQVGIPALVERAFTIRDYKQENQSLNGLSIVNYYQRKPFHPDRLFELMYTVEGDIDMANAFKGVLLLNGFIWLASDMEQNYIFEIEEKEDTVCPGRPFYSTLKESEWEPMFKEQIKREISLFKYQDRKTELSIIAIDADGFSSEALISKLDKCLLTDAEMELGPNAWKDYENPFAKLGQPLEDEDDYEDEQ